MADSTVTVVGNLTRDPELRYTTGGRGVASFGLAVNRRYQVNGEWQEQVSFLNVTAWGQLGENAAATLTKGSRAIVFGRLEQRSWETQDGEKRSVVEIVADEIGPSLRWAQAQIERNERSTTEGGFAANRGGGGGGGGSSGEGSGGGSGGGGGSRQPDPVYGDEEPF
ncbi:MAG: single-stranded DNA-binding protein [Ilumatobacteraceae bacterium]